MTISVVSGYFNPLHSGHIDYIDAAARFGKVIVIVNNDDQVKVKGSQPFMSADDRLRIVRSLKNVMTGMVSIDKDESVIESLMLLSDLFITEEMVFCNGGDRTPEAANSKEEQFCRLNNIRLEYNVGGGKTRSSSELLKSAVPSRPVNWPEGWAWPPHTTVKTHAYILQPFMPTGVMAQTWNFTL